MRVLIATAEDSLGRHLQQAAERAGFAAVRVGQGRRCLAELLKGSWQVALMDERLPDSDVLEIIRRCRARDLGTYFLLLMDGSSVARRISALALGADECVDVPPGVDELAGRLRAVSRRLLPTESCETFAYGAWRIDFGFSTAVWRGRPLALTPLEARLLASLMRGRGRPVPFCRLVAEGWSDYEEVARDRVFAAISRLRRKIARVGSPDLVRTIRTIGYAFCIK